ncbi:SpoIID/LytB domain-containing protein [Nocardia sp. NPDC005978]|uniref:SpoIID/LytB domain-containing protein n=1 Tax=unclassified Nocardia TaxID=2637762 RepID=UPI0033AC341D
MALSLAATTMAGTSAGLLWAWPDGEFRVTASPGHGRGLSQNGAFDRALEGNTAESILAHYYPGAELQTIASTPIRVRLQQQDDSTLDVESESGLYVAGRRVIPGQAAHLTPTETGADVVITTGCEGEVLWEGTTDDPYIYPLEAGSDRPAEEHLSLCGGNAYRGVLGVALEDGAYRTVNEVDIEDYLKGVVPAEMVPNWADKGGAEALRAQAIAARSYALAEDRYVYAQTCDSTDCQMYPGTEREDSRTSEAVRVSAGKVLVHEGHILRAEYSAAPDAGIPSIENLSVGPAVSEFPSAPTMVDPTVPPIDPTTEDPSYGPTYGPPTHSDPTLPTDTEYTIPLDLPSLLNEIFPPAPRRVDLQPNRPRVPAPATSEPLAAVPPSAAAGGYADE